MSTTKKICVNKLGPSWPVSTKRVWRELNLSLGKMAEGSDREVTQADQNNINSQWSLFFKDLDELLSEYEQHRSTEIEWIPGRLEGQNLTSRKRH